MSTPTIYKIRAVDPEGFMRVVLQYAQTAEDAIKDAAATGKLHVYEHVVEVTAS
jgi:hypothetical protein